MNKDQITNIQKKRSSSIKYGYVDTIQNKYITNSLVKELHPKMIHVKVSKIVQETPDTKSFYLKTVDGSPMPPFQAGQYISLQVPIDYHLYKRPYSITSSPSNLSEYRITVKKVPHGLVSNCLFDNMLENDSLILSGPYGNFTYSTIRDLEDVLAIAGGSGITSIMPFIYETITKHKINSLTLIYGCKTENDIIFKKELDTIVKNNPNIKVVYVLSEEYREGMGHGFISKEMIMEQDPMNKSIFICGPNKMYHHLNDILTSLDIPNKYIRHEIYTDYPDKLSNQEFKLHIKTKGQVITIPCHGNETLLTSMEKLGINVPAHCTVGVCGYCRSKLIDGEIKTNEANLRAADHVFHYFHPCVSYPLSDITIELPF